MARKVLWITADQLRFDHLGCTGHPLQPTPELDQFASEGTLFLNHFTNAIPCGPSRASLHTGLYACNHRSVTNGTPLDRRHTNLALEVRKAGLEPLLLGYTDTSADPRELSPQDPALNSYEGVLPGFRQVVDLNLEHLERWREWLEDLGYDLPNSTQMYHHRHPSVAGSRFCDDPAWYRAEHSDTAFLTNQALSLLKQRGQEDWFVHLSYLRPHPPLVAPAPYHRLYDWQQVPRPQRGVSAEADAALHPLLSFWQQRIDRPEYFGSRVSMLRLNEEDTQRARAVYLGLIRELDHHLGRIFRYLKESGQWEEVLILFSADHGEQLGDHYLWGKGGFFDASWHVPLIIRDPRTASRNSLVQDFTEHVDLAPTILDWLGLEVPVAMDGQSLAPLWKGKRPDSWRTGIFGEFDWRSLAARQIHTDPQRSYEQQQLCLWRDASFKYVHFAQHPPLLFDLQTDPQETRNLAEEPKYLATCNHYLDCLLRHRMLHTDRQLTLWQLA